MKKKLPIFIKLTLNSLIIIITILITYTSIQLISFNSFSSDYQEDQLINKYKQINLLANSPDITITKEGLYNYLSKTSSKKKDLVRIYSNENIQYSTPDKIWNEFSLVNSKKIKTHTEFIDFDKYIILTAPITIDNTPYTIQMVQNIKIFDEFIESYFPLLLFVGFLAIVLSIIGAIYMSKSFLNKLKLLTNTMNDIKNKGINHRAEVSNFKDEFDKVNIVFNSMMDEVENVFEEQSRFVADTSHELKTPLTALQGHLTMLKRWGKNDKDRLEKSLDICLDEVNRLKKIVSDMLLLSKLEKSNLDLDIVVPINPSPVIDSVLSNYRILNSNVNYKVSIDEALKVKILESDLKQLLIIFIDNSIKYNDKDKIEISISISKYGDKTKISIKDNGIGIPKEDIDNVLNRFYKVDKSRVHNNSFGLGLSIANRLVKNYKGTISILSKLGVYTDITIII